MLHITDQQLMLYIYIVYDYVIIPMSMATHRTCSSSVQQIMIIPMLIHKYLNVIYLNNRVLVFLSLNIIFVTYHG